MTGIETILFDDPSLTVRLSKKDLGIEKQIEQPLRVVLDTHLRIPATAKTLHLPGKVLIYTCSDNKEKIKKLQGDNIDVVNINISLNQVDIKDVMSDLANRGINEVMVEAGSTLVGKLLDQNIVDEMIIYIAPHILGDSGRGLAKLSSITTMRDRIELKLVENKIVGNEIKIRAKPVTN